MPPPQRARKAGRPKKAKNDIPGSIAEAERITPTVKVKIASGELFGLCHILGNIDMFIFIIEHIMPMLDDAKA